MKDMDVLIGQYILYMHAGDIIELQIIKKERKERKKRNIFLDLQNSCLKGAPTLSCHNVIP